MPRIYDNIEVALLPALKQTLELSIRSDFCVGYFNLRGWKQIDACIDQWPGGNGQCCRLLVGMQRLPQEELRVAFSLTKPEESVDNQAAIRLKKKLAEEFRLQLSYGIPTNDDESGLRRLAAQLKSGKVVVKLFLRHTLHAKLYLCFRSDPINPIIGYLGSSNLTLSGLSYQGELNIDVMDHDAALKLTKWFEDRWNDRWCIDITQELIEVIEQSWASEVAVPPYHMRHDVEELARFPREGSVAISVELIRRVSPDSLSVIEFKEPLDVEITEKMSVFPLLHGDPQGWNLELYGEELNMTRSAESFLARPTKSPVYEGGMIWQFDHLYAEPRYWVKESELREIFREKKLKRIEGLERVPKNLVNDYEVIRIALRKIASNTNERTLIAALVPPYSFAGNSLSVHFPHFHDQTKYQSLRFSAADLAVLVAMLNSFVMDYILRARMTTNLNLFYLYQLPAPRPSSSGTEYRSLAERAARLVGTTTEFDDLLKEIFGPRATHRSHGERTPEGRAKLRAEIDAQVAHLYSLTEPEFTHILSTFPLVPEPVKAAALAEFRRVMPNPDDVAFGRIIAAGENNHVEFKEAAAWNAFKQAKDDSMRQKIAQTVAGFMNAEGGTLVVGVTDAGKIVGIKDDIRAADAKKSNPDGYELFLRNFLRATLGGETSKFFTISFHMIGEKQVCRIAVKSAPGPVFIDGRLFVRSGNQTSELNAQAATAYQKQHWG